MGSRLRHGFGLSAPSGVMAQALPSSRSKLLGCCWATMWSVAGAHLCLVRCMYWIVWLCRHDAGRRNIAGLPYPPTLGAGCFVCGGVAQGLHHVLVLSPILLIQHEKNGRITRTDQNADTE